MIQISGHSDDIISISGLPSGDDEISGDGANFVIGRAEAIEGQDAQGIRVKMRYVKGGVWAATLEPIDEGVVCPWPVKVGIAGYTAVVIIECPSDTPVTWKKVRVTSR
jgi:hypothetical protein